MVNENRDSLVKRLTRIGRIIVLDGTRDRSLFNEYEKETVESDKLEYVTPRSVIERSAVFYFPDMEGTYAELDTRYALGQKFSGIIVGSANKCWGSVSSVFYFEPGFIKKLRDGFFGIWNVSTPVWHLAHREDWKLEGSFGEMPNPSLVDNPNDREKIYREILERIDHFYEHPEKYESGWWGG